MSFWLKILAAVAAVWLVAFGVIHFARSTKPTPESVSALLDPAALDGKSQPDRAKYIDKTAAQLNRLEYDDRQKLRDERLPEKFFRALDKAEQAHFLDATLPTGFKQMMEAFNKMDSVKRRQFVQRALADMKQHEGERPKGDINDPNVRKMVDEGLRSFYSDASAETKLDLAPLMEQMQRNLESFGK